MQHQNIEDIIKSRRSVFPPQFTDQKISKEVIQQILESANWAPTHKKTEPWRFKVIRNQQREKFGDFLVEAYQKITDPDKVKEFKKKKIRENCQNSQAIVAICMQRDPKERIPEWEEVAATAMAVQNLWLTSHSLGIGGYWSSPGMISEAGNFFNLAEGEKCLGFFFMGYYDPSTELNNERGNMNDKLVWME
ncbi:nitroreductase [Aquimarina sp. ERC-38]|uniref:nitroreductase family protein n=1 Tax=Aquimarina sp. ERC-38 TaxID=2949996 RepID=UPI002247E7DC|nr:nitroreductase [Aquimarina sp. ERC-38]UZO81078.1 nitroreductase [Aquimarina sp. ERC-38]